LKIHYVLLLHSSQGKVPPHHIPEFQIANIELTILPCSQELDLLNQLDFLN
jgi:hypothetical protein